VDGIAATFSEELISFGAVADGQHCHHVGVLATVMYILSMASLFKLRRSQPCLERPYNAPVFPLFPAFALMAAVVVVCAARPV
jgi:ethanolamine permease